MLSSEAKTGRPRQSTRWVEPAAEKRSVRGGNVLAVVRRSFQDRKHGRQSVSRIDSIKGRYGLVRRTGRSKRTA